MKNELVRIEPVALMPTPSGSAVFLGDGRKVILIYIDPAIGASINMVMQQQKPPRPLTHDLLHSVLGAFDAKVSRFVINRVEDGIFYARIFIEAQQADGMKRIIEFDVRPSDGIALAVRANAPMYVSADTWAELDDVNELLMSMRDMSTEEGEE